MILCQPKKVSLITFFRMAIVGPGERSNCMASVGQSLCTAAPVGAPLIRYKHSSRTRLLIHQR